MDFVFVAGIGLFLLIMAGLVAGCARLADRQGAKR